MADTQTDLRFESKMVGPDAAHTKMAETQTEFKVVNLVEHEVKSMGTQTNVEDSIQKVTTLDELENFRRQRYSINYFLVFVKVFHC